MFTNAIPLGCKCPHMPIFIGGRGQLSRGHMSVHRFTIINKKKATYTILSVWI